jgi:hypothetical protein
VLKNAGAVEQAPVMLVADAAIFMVLGRKSFSVIVTKNQYFSSSSARIQGIQLFRYVAYLLLIVSRVDKITYERIIARTI